MENYKVKLILLDDQDNPIGGIVATSSAMDDLRKQKNLSPLDEMLNILLDREGRMEKHRKIHKRIQLVAKIAAAQIGRMEDEHPDHYRNVETIIDENSKEEAVSMLCVSGLWFGTKEELEALWDEIL